MNKMLKNNLSKVPGPQDVRCNLCSGTDFGNFLPAYSRLLGSVPEMQLVQCKHCGLVFLHPKPNWDELKEFYPESYYKQNSTIGMGARLGRIHEGLSRGAVFVPDGRLLDVGCGNGDYLARAEMRGMRAFGLEPNIHGFLICKSRGLNVKNAFLEDSGYPQDFFDIITVNHVLEHVPDPLSSLLLIKSLLKPNGIAIIQVPNISSLAFYASREHFLHLDVPRHLFHFEKNTLSAYLDKAGLRLLRVRYYTSAMALLESLFLRTRGSRPISANNKDVARRGAVLSPFIEILFTPFKILLNNLELGDVFEVYATKV